MRTRALAQFIYLACCVLGARAHAQQVTTTVDTTRPEVGEAIEFQVSIEGARGATPVLPDLSAFEVTSHGQSSQVQIVNGHVHQSVTYLYSLVPKVAGRFTIGPVEAVIKKQRYQSAPLTVHVGDPAPGETAHPELYVHAEVSTLQPVLGEQVTYTWRLYRRIQIAGARVTMPGFEGFFVHDLGEQRDYEEVQDGERYLVSEVKKALFAQDTGVHDISGSRLDCQVAQRRAQNNGFGGLFGQKMVARQARSEPLRLDVAPLTQIPEGYSGVVGELHVHTEVTRTHLRAGESATLTATFTGDGDLAHMTLPPPPHISGVKVYQDKPHIINEIKKGRMGGKLVMSWVFVPNRAGTLSIPETPVYTYDRATNSFAACAIAGAELEVEADPDEPIGLPVGPPIDAPSAPTTLREQVELLGGGLIPVVHEGTSFGRYLTFSPPVTTSLSALPLALQGLLWAGAAARRRYRSSSGGRRGLEKVACGPLAPMRVALQQENYKEAAAQGARGLRTLLDVYFGLQARSVTPSEARSLLERAGVAATLAVTTESHLERFDAVQFGSAQLAGLHLGNADEIARLIGDLSRALYRTKK